MDGGAWKAAVHGVAKSQTTELSNGSAQTTAEQLHFHFSLSCIGKGNGNPLQCSCLENPRDGGAWWAAIYGVTQSRTGLKRLSSSSSSRVWEIKGGVPQAVVLNWDDIYKNSGVDNSEDTEERGDANS